MLPRLLLLQVLSWAGRLCAAAAVLPLGVATQALSIARRILAAAALPGRNAPPGAAAPCCCALWLVLACESQLPAVPGRGQFAKLLRLQPWFVLSVSSLPAAVAGLLLQWAAAVHCRMLRAGMDL